MNNTHSSDRTERRVNKAAVEKENRLRLHLIFERASAPTEYDYFSVSVIVLHVA